MDTMCVYLGTYPATMTCVQTFPKPISTTWSYRQTKSWYDNITSSCSCSCAAGWEEARPFFLLSHLPALSVHLHKQTFLESRLQMWQRDGLACVARPVAVCCGRASACYPEKGHHTHCYKISSSRLSQCPFEPLANHQKEAQHSKPGVPLPRSH